MKKILTILFLIPVIGFAQTPVNTPKLILGSAYPDSAIQMQLNSLNNAIKMNMDSTTKVSDTLKTLKASANTIKGTFSAVAGLLQQSYVVTHNAGFVPASVMTQPINQVSANLNWVSNVTSTTFTYNVISPLAVGQTISFYWLVIKI